MNRSYDCHLWRASLAQARAVREFCAHLPPTEWEDTVAALKTAAFAIPIHVAEVSRLHCALDAACCLSMAQVYSAQIDCFLVILRGMGLAPATAVAPLLRGADEVARLLHLLKRGLHDPAARWKAVGFERHAPAWLEAEAPQVVAELHDDSSYGGLQ
jgi:hypothetical protein